METIRISNEIPVMPYHDIIVAGGGVAGIAAAVSARREGKSVLLIEKSFMLGGLATLGLINFFVPMCNGRGKMIIGGLCKELVDLSVKYGYDSIPSEWKKGEPEAPTQVRYVTRYSPSIFALALTEYLLSEGVELIYDTVITNVLMEGKTCKGLITENKSGSRFYPASVIIDCTGDADVFSKAGAETITGRNFYTYWAHSISLDSCKKALDSNDIGKAVFYRQGGPASLYGNSHQNGMPTFRGTSGEEFSEYVISNQLTLLAKLKKEDKNSRDIVMLPGMAQMRETKCIKGGYTLIEEDKFKRFDDSVCLAPDFDRRDFLYEIPYRSMVDKNFDNLITAGRSVSSSGYAWSVVRVIPSAIMTGESAGIAASIAKDSGDINRIDIKLLQKKITDRGIMLHAADDLIPNEYRK